MNMLLTTSMTDKPSDLNVFAIASHTHVHNHFLPIAFVPGENSKTVLSL